MTLAGLAAAPVTPLPLHALRPAELEEFFGRLSPAEAEFLRAQHFAAAAGSLHLLPGRFGIQGAVFGLGGEDSLFAFGALGPALPAGSVWRLQPGSFDHDNATLGFLLGAYAYERLKPRARQPAQLLLGDISPRVLATAEAVIFARDLINTPPNLLGPAELADAAVALAEAHGAQVERITGPNATESAPLVSLCGKGVCFDTGGYDLKPGAAMLRMKKDMGGAAILLGLARLVMSQDLNVRLHLRIGCVENSISGHAMRPSDVLRTHAGITVEVGNTDAEGRLVLCDLLAEAAAELPDMLLDAATLTGAARVALGPDLPALFSNNEALANDILAAGNAVQDPLWRLPLWPGYNSWLDSNVADINNVASKPFAGAIVAALFLKRFVPDSINWAHIDAYAWNDQPRPGRPEGGEAQSLRALFFVIEKMAQAGSRAKE